MTQAFPKVRRLRSRRQFLRVQRKGRRLDGSTLFLLVAKDRARSQRFGFTVSKKVGKAVLRNRVRRRLREIVRQHRKARFKEGYHVVVVARPGAAEASFETLQSELLRLAERI